MLLGIDPLLHGRLLGVLDAMGHTDLLLIADGNFPASRVGVPAYRVGADAIRTLDAVLSVFPVDDADRAGITVRPDSEGAVLNHRQRAAEEVVLSHLPTLQFRIPTVQEYREALGRVRGLIITTDHRPSGFLVRKGIVDDASTV